MNRAGEYTKNLKGVMSYNSYNPAKLPLEIPIAIDNEILELLKEAYHNLGILEGVSSFIPDNDIFISMHINKEALLSSQIEGTIATLDNLFDPLIDKNINSDIIDVLSYIKTINYANKRVKQLPISVRLIKELHKTLISNIRGEEKNPGQFRNSQNWIGPSGSNLNNASFIPPNLSDMKESLSNLEKFIHYDQTNDFLIKIALIHYQFETIHPFLDGNGRIGRLLINLLLKEDNFLTHDTLYLSYYFKHNRQEYYDRLTDVRTKGYYEAWVKFFLKGISEVSENAYKCIISLSLLKTKNTKLIESTTRIKSNTINLVFDYIQSHPIIDITLTSKAINKSFNATSNSIKQLIDLNILKQIDNKDRYRVFIYEEYLTLLREGTQLY